jgi:hypothetical protein
VRIFHAAAIPSVTRREIIALRRGLPIFRGRGAARPRLREPEALRLADALPPPVFDADRRLRELDQREEICLAVASFDIFNFIS